jgi:excisionase family DNA binding protein
MTSNVMTAKEAAEYLRISLTTLYRLRTEDPTFPSLMVGKSIRFTADDLDEWLRAQRMGPR